MILRSMLKDKFFLQSCLKPYIFLLKFFVGHYKIQKISKKIWIFKQNFSKKFIFQ